jgi:hypothetical protein
MKRSSIGILILLCCIPFSANADIDITSLGLGISPSALHDALVTEQFVFKNFTAKRIVAIKKSAVESRPGTEFPQIYESTEVTAKMCSGKVFELQMRSIYGSDIKNLLLGRKQFYSYLEKNKALAELIKTHKKEDNPQVVLKFQIDRNASGGSVRGTENAQVAIGISKRLWRGTEQNKEPILEMTYVLRNKWFCPE